MHQKWAPPQRIVTDLVDVLVGLDEVDAELAQGCGGRVSEVLGDARLHGLNVRWGVRTCQLLLVHQPPVQHRMSSTHTNALSGWKDTTNILSEKPLTLSSDAAFTCHLLIGALQFLTVGYYDLKKIQAHFWVYIKERTFLTKVNLGCKTLNLTDIISLADGLQVY